MTRRRRRLVAVLAMLSCAGAPQAGACELVLSEHRSGRALARLPLDPVRPAMEIAFTHSVLGTTVRDRYEWRQGDGGVYAELVQERFEGEGYGLPHAPGPGEMLVREAQGWRLDLRRRVDPLVVRALSSQQMRVLVAGQPALYLGELNAPMPSDARGSPRPDAPPIHMQAQGCLAPNEKQP